MLCLFLLLILILHFGEYACDLTPVEALELLEKGDKYFKNRKLETAERYYTEAVNGAPTYYLSFYKRSQIHFLQGRHKEELHDLTQCLSFRPDFLEARIKKIQTLFLFGNVERIAKHIQEGLKYHPYSNDLDNLKLNLQTLKLLWTSGNPLFKDKGELNRTEAQMMLFDIQKISPLDHKIHEIGVKLYKPKGKGALTHYYHLVQIGKKMKTTNGFATLAEKYLLQGFVNESMTVIKECLLIYQLDAKCAQFRNEHKSLLEAFERLNRSFKSMDDRCILRGKKALSLTSHENVVYAIKRIMCSCYSGLNKIYEAIGVCSDIVDTVEDPSIYCDRAEAFFKVRLYEEAIRDFKAALVIDPESARAKSGVEECENRLKRPSIEFVVCSVLLLLYILDVLEYLKSSKYINSGMRVILKAGNFIFGEDCFVVFI